MEQQSQQQSQQAPREITGLLLVSIALLLGLGVVYTAGRRAEITANWAKYRTDPLLLFMAFLFKPDEDPRSRFQFAADNYSEVVKVYMDKITAVALTPVYQIFGVLSESIGSATNGLGAIKSLFGDMFKKFQSIVDIFMQRFEKVARALKSTFRQLLQALQHVWATAVASVYAGLSTIYTMQNTLRLMVNIVVTIMIILAVLMFFFFFTLWPLLPVILLGGYMIGEMGPIIESATGGDGGAKDAASLAIGMCFAPSTRVVLLDGSDVAIRDIGLGDRLATTVSVEGIGPNVVTGLLRFEEPVQLYSLHGVLVSGSHIVWEGDQPLFVKDHPTATLSVQTRSILCLLTSHRRIPILSDKGVLSFADWEELEDEDDAALQAWYEHVDAVLNEGERQGELRKRADEEAGLSGNVPVKTPDGETFLRDVQPGDFVIDAEGGPTRVTGVVTLQGGSKAVYPLGEGFLTTGSWARLRKGGRWEQPLETTKHEESVWHHLFTESGTFTIRSGSDNKDVALRDFSDVGTDLPTTYETTLKAMALNGRKNRGP